MGSNVVGHGALGHRYPDKVSEARSPGHRPLVADATCRPTARATQALSLRSGDRSTHSAFAIEWPSGPSLAFVDGRTSSSPGSESRSSSTAASAQVSDMAAPASSTTSSTGLRRSGPTAVVTQDTPLCFKRPGGKCCDSGNTRMLRTSSSGSHQPSPTLIIEPFRPSVERWPIGCSA